MFFIVLVSYNNPDFRTRTSYWLLLSNSARYVMFLWPKHLLHWNCTITETLKVVTESQCCVGCTFYAERVTLHSIAIFRVPHYRLCVNFPPTLQRSLPPHHWNVTSSPHQISPPSLTQGSIHSFLPAVSH